MGTKENFCFNSKIGDVAVMIGDVSGIACHSGISSRQEGVLLF